MDRRFISLFLSLCLAAPLTVSAEDLSTAEILRSALNKDCLDYKVRGVCLWLDCNPTGCHVRSSPRVQHYLPDAVVLAYTQRSPWRIEDALHEPLRRGLKLGGAAWALNDYTTRFYQAAVIGSPALALIKQNHVLPLCPSAARPDRAYFLSAADSLAWQLLPSPEVFSIDGFRRLIGGGADVWGHVLPRHGFVVQAHTHKAAAVIAQRAADIVTDKRAKHVYKHLDSECGKGCNGPPPLRENSAAGGYWQPLYPKPAACGVFGKPSFPAATGGDGREAYAWHLWRPYRCCKPMGQILLQVLEHGANE